MLYEVLGGFQRKEAVSKLELSEECLAVGVNSVTDNSYRNRQRFIHGLKKLCLTLVMMGGGPYVPPQSVFIFFTKNLPPRPKP